MQMTFRWFGDTKDTVSLEQIRQIPGVKGIVPALHTLPAGEVWPLDMIMDMKHEIEEYMAQTPCRVCGGKRLKPESLAVTVDGKSIA